MHKSKILYWSLIVTFAILYACTGFVSFYHSISFFSLANPGWLAIILSLVFEIGQASVLFSIMLTKNKNNFLAWAVMIILTSLQVIGNIFSSFKFISESSNVDYQYFQKSILFWVDADPEMFKVIIAAIVGGILPLIALSMTALVAENIKMKDEEDRIVPDIVQPVKNIEEKESLAVNNPEKPVEDIIAANEEIVDDFSPDDVDDAFIKNPEDIEPPKN